MWNCIFIIFIFNGFQIDLHSMQMDLKENKTTIAETHLFRHHHSPSARYLYKRSDLPASVGEILPDIVTAEQMLRVVAGQSVHLTCIVNNLGKYVVMWKQNKRVISAGNLLVRKDNRFSLNILENKFVLEIKDITLEDASDYKCEVDIMGRPISIVHTLEVLIAPQIQAKESKVRLKKGENYSLRCSAHGHPIPRISWTKKDQYQHTLVYLWIL